MKQPIKKLALAGYKITKPRMAVLKYLSSHHSPISARNLHKKTAENNQASIYRTLNLLEKLQIINAEIIKKEKMYCLSDEPHHHITCRNCGYSERVKCDHYRKNFKNFTDVSHQLILAGVCNKCHK